MKNEYFLKIGQFVREHAFKFIFLFLFKRAEEREIALRRNSMSIKIKLMMLSILGTACGERAKNTLELQGDYRSEGSKELSIRARGLGCSLKEISVRGIRFDLKETLYEKSDCTGEPTGRVTVESHFKTGKRIAGKERVRAIDLTIKKVVVTPLSKKFAEVFGANVSGDCRLHEVAVGKDKEVTGMNCGTFGEFPAKDSIYYASFYQTADHVYFSDLPQQAPDHIGHKDDPADRNTEAPNRYREK